MSTTADWQGELGRKWAEGSDAQDLALGALGDLGLAQLAAELGGLAGRRVLDLGCGAGATTRALAEAGADPVGADVSPDLLALARARHPGLSFVLGDAATAPPPGPFDALFSRFGCMFFDAPVAAWSGLRAQMAPGAPLVCVAWRSIKHNDWAGLPLRACAGLYEPFERAAPGAPGPFGWADPDVFAPWLREAGWRSVDWRPDEAPMPLSFGEAPDPVARAVAFALKVGPLASRLAEAAPEVRAKAATRLHAALMDRQEGDAVRLPGAVWIVTARA